MNNKDTQANLENVIKTEGLQNETDYILICNNKFLFKRDDIRDVFIDLVSAFGTLLKQQDKETIKQVISNFRKVLLKWEKKWTLK